jgi:hypothetical protein
MTDSIPPQGMVEWSRTAATLLRAVARAHPHRIPDDVKADADAIWAVASRGAMLQGMIEAQSSALERFLGTSGGLRAEIVWQIEAADAERAEQLRGELARYDDAHQRDLEAGRAILVLRVKEARECEKEFGEARARLVERLRDKAACRDLLDELR